MLTLQNHAESGIIPNNHDHFLPSNEGRIPKAAESIRIPIIAAGGIADGKGFLAALALGKERRG